MPSTTKPSKSLVMKQISKGTLSVLAFNAIGLFDTEICRSTKWIKISPTKINKNR